MKEARTKRQSYAKAPGRQVKELLELKLEELRTAREHLAAQAEQLNARQTELERERLRYRELFDFAPDPYLVTDLNSHIQEANQAACRLLGHDLHFLSRTPLLRFFAREDREKVRKLLSHFRRRTFQPAESLEALLCPPRQQPIPCALRVSAVHAPAGPIAGFRWLLRDITKRKQTEAELRQSEQRYRRLFDDNLAGVYLTRLDGTILDFNEAMRRMLGYESRAELLQHHSSEFYADPSLRRDLLRQLQAQGVVRGREARLRRKDGSVLHALGAAVLLVDESTGEPYIQGVAVDITERKQAEDALRASESRFAAFMGYLPGAAWLKDIQGRYVYANPEAERIFAAPLSSLCGKTDQDIFPPETARQFRENDCRVLADRGSLQTVEVLSQPDGVRHHSIVSKFVVPGLDGQPGYVGGVAFDITERKQAEDALLQARDELARANQELERKVQERTAQLRETVEELEHFSYTLTHDMRAPLRAMQGLGSILVAECAECLHTDRRDYLRRIAEAAQRMDRLITDALNFSKTVRQQFDLLTIDPAALLRGIIESYPQFQPPKAEVVIAGELPPVVANEAGLTQVFSNLLGNAVKFVDPGKTPRIRVWAQIVEDTDEGSVVAPPPPADTRALSDVPRHFGQYVRIWFEDNGIGIEKEYHQKIWQMFQRLSHNYEGTGIGLALVKKSVERMRGRVGVESEPGEGSRFWVELRRA